MSRSDRRSGRTRLVRRPALGPDRGRWPGDGSKVGHGRQPVAGPALGWFADALPNVPVVLATQAANDRAMRLAVKLGFTEVERFEAYDAEQWFGVCS
jgi:hypothetical protein